MTETKPEPPKPVDPIPPEPPQTSETPPKEPEQAEPKLEDRVTYLEAQRLESKKKELLEIETRLDKKMSGFKQFVADTEVQGRSLATPETTDEEKAKKELNEALEGTGLNV